MTFQDMTEAERTAHMRRSLAAPVRLPVSADARSELADTAGLIRLGLAGIHGPTVPPDIHMPKTAPTVPSAQAMKTYAAACVRGHRLQVKRTPAEAAPITCPTCGKRAYAYKRLG